MRESAWVFDQVRRLEPEAIGEPGQRTFRLLIENDEAAASLWLEKEQLQFLALAIEQLLATLPERAGGEEPPPLLRPFPSDPSIEFKIGRLTLGYDEERDSYVLVAHDLDEDLEGPGTLLCRATRGQLRKLSRAIIDVVSRGRPRCPICGEPAVPEPHRCIRANGHVH
jgi:uncharacterized repeat protein (TIGR03847 family)